jgi:hypothetical protein
MVAHGLGVPSMRSFTHKVKMIRHQRESKHLNWVARFCSRKDKKKGLAILSFTERFRADHFLG